MNVHYVVNDAGKKQYTGQAKKSVLTSILFCIAMLAFCRPARAYIQITGGAPFVQAKQCQVIIDSAIVQLLYMPTDGLVEINCWEGCEVSLDKVSWTIANTFYLPAGADTQKVYYRLTFPSAVSSSAFYTGFDVYSAGEGQTLIVGAQPGISAASISSDGPVVCIGATAHLSSDVYDGMSYSWAGPDGFTSSVPAPSFVVSTSSEGVYSMTMTMTGSWGCTATVTTNVLAVSDPGPITGNVPVCAGLTKALSVSVHGGTWSSSNAPVATVGAASGIVTGIAAGTSVISYINGVCSASAVMTVNNTYPAAISGTASVCSGSTTTLTNTVTGGIWSSGFSGIAAIGSSTGIVSGYSFGTVIVTYNLGGCGVTKIVTVNPVPTTEGWAVKAPIPQPRSHFGAAAVDSIIYVVGGSNGSIAVNTMYAYNINSNTWSVKAPMSVPRVELAVVAVNGKIYALGGFNTWSVNTVEEYDPATDTWTTKAPMPRRRAQLSAAVIGNKIYVEAGWIGSYPELDVYDVTTDTWETMAPMDFGRLGISAAVGLNNKFYFLGGRNYSSSAFYDLTSVYDVASDSWSAGPYMPYHRFGGAATVLYDRIYYMGGATGGSYLPNYNTNNYLNPATGVWYTAQDLINKRSAGCAVTANNKIYLLGGMDSVGSLVAWNHQYTPAGITVAGASVICAGATSSFGSDATGGTWSSSNVSVATVGTGGVVTGVSGGTAVISYTKTGTCGSFTGTKTVTVNTFPAVASITGGSTVCTGVTITLSNATGGGVWSSGNTTVAAIGATGIVTGVAAGTAIISYTVANSCGAASATMIITVNATGVEAIAGTASVCVGATTTLTNSTGGGVWSSSNTAIATVGTSGIVSGIAPGTVLISYSYTDVCGTSVVSKVVSVDSLTEAGTITGASTVCEGASVTLSDAVSGGTWSSSNTAIATVGTSGMVTGVAPGTALISYSYTNGCGMATVSKVVTVNPLADAGTITGAANVCAGSSITLSDIITGGEWTSSNTGVATVGTSGMVTGVADGTATLSYSVSNTCGLSAATAIVTVSNTATAGTITGPAFVCSGSSITLSDIITGGTWTSSNTAKAVVDSTGMVSGIATGTAVISYAVTNGCGSAVATRTITVNPVLPSIGGVSSICVDATATLTNSVPAGVWSSSNEGIAAIDASGILTGVSAGTVVISYTVCSTIKIKTISVNALPYVPAISPGTGMVCAGATLALSESTTGGTHLWTSNNTSVATVNASTGLVTGIAAGTATISYKYVLGCTNYAMTDVTVNGLTSTTITGTAIVCAGGSTTALTAIPEGGTWSSGAPTKATIDASTGVVTGLVTGTSQITYTYTNSDGCTGKTYKIVTVNALPTIATLGGASAVCVDATATVTVTTAGGMWSSSESGIATIGSSTGIVTGIDAGAVVVSYSLTGANGCSNFRTKNITVNALPSVPEISAGTGAVCVSSTLALSESTTGGTHLWTSSNTSVATVNSSTGLVTGIAGGTVTISYKYVLGCTNYAMAEVTVNAPTAVAITGTAIVCAGGSTTALASDPDGGSWTSGTPAKATIDGTSGLVTGVAAGTSRMTYTYINSYGCGSKAYQVVTVNALPAIAALAGASAVCAGATATITVTTSGGTWSSGNPAVATIGSTGIVTGIDAGVAVISYSVTGANGCSDFRTRNVTVNALASVPEIAAGTGKVCVGSTLALSESTTGGTYLWTSSNTTVATVNSATGVVTGVATGTVVVSYKYTFGCTNYAMTTVTVNPALSMAITGAATVCGGNTTTLTGTPTGGSWLSSASAVATVDASSGVVTGIVSGTTTITYTSATGCYSTKPVTVNTQPAAIAGPGSLCAGATATCTNAVSGGLWVSSNTSAVSVGSASGIVNAIAAGTSIITYTLTGGCISTKIISVNALPGVISGATSVCAGSSITLTSAGPAGTWSSTATGIATAGSSTGIVTGVAAGVANIIYTTAAGCSRNVFVTVNPLPEIITGITTLCSATSATLSDATTGGAWSSTTPSVATITTGGMVTGITPGTTIISYTSGMGCARTTTVTVVSSLPALTGTPVTCVGLTTILSHSATGGNWTTGNGVIATVTSGGVVSGVSTGTVNITYTIVPGCSTAANVTVNGMVPVITGTPAVCEGATTSLANAAAGGTWSSSNPALAVVSATGVVTGIAAGTPVISYVLSSGCYRAIYMNVKPLPGAISGNMGVCIGGTSVVTDGTGTSWSSSNPAVVTIGVLSGVITGISAGTSMITFNAANGCIATRMATVDATTSVAAITGPSGVLVGATVTLSNATAGGVWSSNSTARATVSSGGVVTGISAPAVTISYTVTSGVCNVSVTKLLTVTTHRYASPGYDEEETSLDFKVYPNPSTGSLNVRSSQDGIFTVYTLEGKKVQSVDIFAGEVKFSLPKELAAGIYMCRFNGEDGSSTMVRLVRE